MSRSSGTKDRLRTLVISGIWSRIFAFICLASIYILTAPSNHSISIDPYYYANIITSEPFKTVSQPRELLWIFAMKGLYKSAEVFIQNPDPFRIIGVANSVLMAGAILLLARVLRIDFSLNPLTTWLTAALFAFSYGIWRYASEIEVYATTTLVSLLVIHTAFSLENGAPKNVFFRLFNISVLGGISTLIYQPIGIITAVCVPMYLLTIGRIRFFFVYGLVAGSIVIGGFGLAYLKSQSGASTEPVDFIFQSHELRPESPTLFSLAQMAYGLTTDILSTNWLFAFETTREAFLKASSNNILHEEIYAATKAGWLAWVSLITVPMSLILLGILVMTAIVSPVGRRCDRREGTILVWLLIHSSMMGLLSPSGFEGWLLGLVPFSIIAGVRLVEPSILAGKSVVVILLVAVFVIHNGLVGIGVQFLVSGDYFKARSDEVLVRSESGDLIVITTNWNLHQYLIYSAQAQVVRIDHSGADHARSAIEGTLASGHRVFILDDILSPPESILAQYPGLKQDLVALNHDFLAGAARFKTSDVGWAYVINPEATAQ